jgi:hypothetical protein
MPVSSSFGTENQLGTGSTFSPSIQPNTILVSGKQLASEISKQNLARDWFLVQAIQLAKVLKVLTVRRSSIRILPYTAAMEFGFYRGIGLTRQQGKWQSSIIVSYAPRDGRGSIELDSLGG